jgi:hypothetical protein
VLVREFQHGRNGWKMSIVLGVTSGFDRPNKADKNLSGKREEQMRSGGAPFESLPSGEERGHLNNRFAHKQRKWMIRISPDENFQMITCDLLSGCEYQKKRSP